VPSLVFDEVDAGIGGQIALQVGDALRSLSEHHQVLVITHLPQIAARAHCHLIVRKSERGGAAAADVEIVEGDARVAEITRMLSGDPSSRTGRDHALELLQSAGTDPASTSGSAAAPAKNAAPAAGPQSPAAASAPPRASPGSRRKSGQRD
jgi:DNA repair protein RecN (Recombination protein N)